MIKALSFLLVGGVGALWFGQGGSSVLQAHLKALQGAPSLTATLNAQVINGIATTYKISYSKPNLLKVETAEGWTLCDGKAIYSYIKKDNTWTESPATDDAIKQTAGLNQAWAWKAFFDKDALKTVTSSKTGATRVLKGAQTTELALTLENGTATFFIDPKLGIARGFTYKAGEVDLLVTSTDIQLGKEPLPAETFAFHAPEGAKKLEAPKVDDAASFAKVQTIMSRNCLPCHGSQQRSGGYELTTYQGIVQGVVAGSPGDSKLVQVVSGPNPTMPKMRPPLRPADVEVVSKWIQDGAKK
jgi:outer membrane lipoprotein-sorting protein